MIIAILLFHVLFVMFLLVFSPIFILLFTYIVKLTFEKVNVKFLKYVLTLVIILSITISCTASAISMLMVKNPKHKVNGLWDYLDYYFEGDASAWKALNEITKPNETIAS